MPVTRKRITRSSGNSAVPGSKAHENAKDLKRVIDNSDELKHVEPTKKRSRKNDKIAEQKEDKKDIVNAKNEGAQELEIEGQNKIESHANKKASRKKTCQTKRLQSSITKNKNSVAKDENVQKINTSCTIIRTDSAIDDTVAVVDTSTPININATSQAVKSEEVDSVEVMSDSSDSDFEEVSEMNIPVKDEKIEGNIKKSGTNSKANSKPASCAKTAKKAPGKSTPLRKPATSEKRLSPKKEEVSLDGVSPMDLLLQLETDAGKSENKPSSKEKVSKQKKSFKKTNETMSDSDSESDWENVADKEMKDQVPEKAVEITLQGPNLFQKRKRKKFDLEDWFQKQVNKYQRSTHLDMHKVHLLCLLSYGFQRNLLCSDETLLALALSHIQLRDLGQPVKKWDTNFLTKFAKWFSKYYSIDAETEERKTELMKTLIASRLETTKVASEEELAYLFALTIRSLGGEVRLVISLQPVSHKPNLKNFLLKRRKSEKNEEDSQDGKTSVGPSSSANSQIGDIVPSSSKIESDKNKEKAAPSQKGKASASTKKKSSASKKQEENDEGSSSKYFKNSKNTTKSKTTKVSKKGSAKQSQKSTSKEDEKRKEPRRIARKSGSAKKSYKETASDDDDLEEDDFELSLNESSSEDERTSSKRTKGKGKKSKTKSSPGSSDEVVELSSGSDFEESNTSFHSPTMNRRKPRNKKIVSSDSEDSVQIVKEKIKARGNDYWAEVYLEKEKKWICVDCLRAEINKPHDLEARATKPVSYILAFDNGNHVKDVTKRYASSFTNTRKNRPDPEWWEETLEPYAGPVAEKDGHEDLQLKAELLQKPLPTSVGEYKKHPLYAMKRHLLKFESIYPESSVPVGFVRGEPVYSRECVHLLHTRENWMKEARVVRIGETAYKLVKGRKKRRQALAGGDVEPVAELFGKWQTEDYIPLPAVDGKVPKNEYGNIEMFKPSMLPGGTVHLKGLNGLNRIARKLNIDVAAAMVGWDHHCGFAHPVLDGWVVCEEHKDILIAAWDEEQEIIREREALKREKRIYGTWKLLIKGVLIRERLKSRFNLEPADGSTQDTATPSGSGEKAGDMAISWPLNRQKEKPKTKTKKKHEGPSFPFEEI